MGGSVTRWVRRARGSDGRVGRRRIVASRIGTKHGRPIASRSLWRETCVNKSVVLALSAMSRTRKIALTTIGLSRLFGFSAILLDLLNPEISPPSARPGLPFLFS